MIDERMAAGEMSKKYPNEWLFIIEPETRENTTHLVSGVVQVHSKSRSEIMEILCSKNPTLFSEKYEKYLDSRTNWANHLK